jgi:hypothetical protein
MSSGRLRHNEVAYLINSACLQSIEGSILVVRGISSSPNPLYVQSVAIRIANLGIQGLTAITKSKATKVA